MRALYVHGLAAGSDTKKGRALAARLADLGVTLNLPSFNPPFFPDLTPGFVTEQIAANMRESGGYDVIIGSSLGGLAVMRYVNGPSALKPRQVILLSPAFELAWLWRRMLGDAALEQWRRDDWIDLSAIYDKVSPAALRYRFFVEATAIATESLRAPVPTLVLHGELDHLVPAEVSRRFVWGAGPLATLDVITGGDHTLLAHIDEVVRKVEAFVIKRDIP